MDSSSSKRSRHEMKESSSKSAKTEEKKPAASGSVPAISEPHECSMFEMSKKIVSGETGCAEETTEKKRKRKKKKKDDERENIDWSKYPNIAEWFENMKVNFPSHNMSSLMKKKLSLIGEEKAKEFNEKWRQLALDKIELDFKMLKLIKDQVDYAFFLH